MKIEITRTRKGNFSIIYPKGREVMVSEYTKAFILANAAKKRYAKKGIACEITYEEKTLETAKEKALALEYTERTKGMSLREKLAFNPVWKEYLAAGKAMPTLIAIPGNADPIVINDPVQARMIAAAPKMLAALKAWVKASGWSSLPDPKDFDESLTKTEVEAWILTRESMSKL